MTITNNEQNNPKGRTFDNFDKLKLKSFAENLLQNIEKGITSSIGEQGAYTISLNAEFGNGKTTFLEMFKNFIEIENPSDYNVISINVWESDFYGEPVIAILSELTNWMKKNKANKDKVKKVLNTIGKIGINIGKQALFQVINKSIHLETGISVDSKKLLDQIGQNIFDDFTKRKEIIREIKTIISEYAKNKKLLIIVDELDRTRPDYAIHFLEDMKHFFDIENIIFLVAVNRKQMEATVKRLYGQDLDFNGYYRKFFKQEINLPDPYKEAQRFVDDLIQKTQVKYNPRTRDKNFRKHNSYLSCRMFNLTLREIELFIRMFATILDSDSKCANWTYIDCYSFFICLFLKENKIFQKILNNNFTIDDFFKFVGNKEIKYMFKENDNLTIEYKNNFLLGTVSTAFIYNEVDLIENKKKIQHKFQAISDVKGLFSFETPHKQIVQGFSLEYGQPAFNICEKINQLKSAFSN